MERKIEQAQIITVMQDAIYVTIKVAAPILIVAMVVGIIISVFQATTQINEQTLAFVPKIIGILLALLISFSWIVSNMTEFTQRIYGYINTMIH